MTTIELPPLPEQVCPRCNGTGETAQPSFVESGKSLMRMCRTCHGTGALRDNFTRDEIEAYARLAIEQDRARRTVPCGSSENQPGDATSVRQVAPEGEREQRISNPPDAGANVQHAGNSAEQDRARRGEPVITGVDDGTRYTVSADGKLRASPQLSES